MAKMMKRLMALAIAVSMVTGVVALPASAEDTTPENQTTVTVEITNDSGKVIGEKTTVSSTDTSETSKEYKQESKTDSSWESKDTETTGSEPVTEGNTTTQTTQEVVTEVSGSESSVDNVHTDKDTGTQTYSGSTSGSEDTKITDTTTTVTTTTGVTLVDTTEGPNTTIDNKVKEEEWSDLQPTGTEGWKETGVDDNDFEKISGTEKTTNPVTSDIDVDEDPLKKQDVTLEMTAPTGNTPSEDSEELYITIEDALKNDISYTDGQVLADGSTVKYKYDTDGKTVIGYTITKITPTGNTPGTITPGTTSDAEKSGKEIKTYIKPEGYTPGTEDITDDDGNVIGTRTTEEIVDQNGNVIGYTITEEVHSQSGAAETIKPLPAPAPTFTLPDRPDAPAPVTANGLTTTVTVEDVTDADGNTIGFKTTKTVTDEDGNEISMESETVYGTKTSATSTLKTTPTSDEVVTTTVTTVYGTLTTQNYTTTTPGTKMDVATRDVSEDIYELVNTDEGLFFLYEGKMYQVQGISDSDYTQGETRMTSLQPNISGLTPGSRDGDVSSSTLLRNPENFTVSGGIAPGYELQYIGYGLESSIKVEHNSGSTLAHQFVLKDEHDKLHYVLCVDFSTSAKRGTSYNMDNVINSGYFDDLDIAKKVEAIAVNGYWGTTSGVGSLDKVKQVLRDAKAAGLINLSDSEINNITPGEALTATQAALWYYGDSSGSTNLDSDVTGPVYTGGTSTRNPYASENNTVNALYKALINLNPSSAGNNTTELLSETNYATEVELVIKEKATDSSGKVKTHTNGNEKYLTDLTFTVDVKKSDLTGNLIVTVTDSKGNKLHDPIQIATEESGLLGNFLADEKAGTTDIILRDLELPEGTLFNLNLSGTQNLAQGAYLYTAEVYSTSQTFIGVAEGKQEVNLNVQMEFSVTDPEAKIQHTNKFWSEKEVDTTTYTKVDNYKREKKGTVTNQNVTVKTSVIGTLEQTDVTVKETDMHREWRNSYFYQLTVTRDEDGGGGDELTEILDEEVALADAPKTGDVTGLLAMICLFSLYGLVVLNRKKGKYEA